MQTRTLALKVVSKIARQRDHYRSTARQIRRTWQHPDGEDRLVAEPVFLLSSERSGSTLLRSLLDSHPDIAAPPEMHLAKLRVTIEDSNGPKALEELGVTTYDLHFLLWDRMLHRVLEQTGKRIIVDKTPHNLDMWVDIAASWPAARYIFLQRHPGAVAASLQEMRPEGGVHFAERRVLLRAAQLDAARSALNGLTVRYEDLTADPERETRRICTYLGVEWTALMTGYHPKRIVRGLGDWSGNFASGQVQPGSRHAVETSHVLVPLAERWGYDANG